MGQKRRILTGFLGMVLSALLLAPAAFAAEDAAIEQAFVNMPSVTVDCRSDEESGVPEAYLGGEKLQTSGDPVTLKDSGKALEYSVLVDISGSISQSRFSDIKSSLSQMVDSLGSTDRFVLYTFGDNVTQVLSGEESREDAKSTIEGLKNGDMTTALFSAIHQAAEDILKEKDADEVHHAIICISDGEDFADNTQDANSVSTDVAAKGIPVYTIAVEKKSETSDEARKNRSSFSTISTSTGGIPWTVDQLPDGVGSIEGNSVRNGLEAVIASVLGTKQMEYTASTNRPSMKNEDLVLRFEDGTELSRALFVSKHIPDTEAPSVTKIEADGNDGLRITYSEAVLGADKPGNYHIRHRDKEIPVSSVQAVSGQENVYALKLGSELYNGSYTLQIQGVTDDSAEENPVALYSTPRELTVSGLTDEDTAPPKVDSIKNLLPDGFEITFSEPVTGADSNGNYTVTLNGKDIPVVQAKPVGKDQKTVQILLQEDLKNGEYQVLLSGIKDASGNLLSKDTWTVTVKGVRLNWKALILRWWPVLLTAVVLIILLLVLLFYSRVKKNKVEVVQGMVVKPENVSRKVQVNVARTPGVELTVWISNGAESPKKIVYPLRGSMIVGRSREQCDVYCSDQMMSKQHFIIAEEENGALSIMDLESTNHTILNGTQIFGKTILHSGDRVRAGNMNFRFEWR